MRFTSTVKRTIIGITVLSLSACAANPTSTPNSAVKTYLHAAVKGNMKEVNKVLYLGPAAHYQKAKYTEADSKVMMGTTMGAASLTSHGGLGSIKILGVKKGHNKAGVEMAVVNFQLYGKDGKAAGSASAITVVKTKEGWKVDIMAT